jgi:hypothetical protein
MRSGSWHGADVAIGYIRGEKTREVSGYEGLYGVSNKGNVYNLLKGTMLEPNRGAYVTLSKGGKIATYRIADLVAREWVVNKMRWAYVRHKDGNVRNNVVGNLEWSSEKEVLRGEKSKLSRKVLQLDMMGGLVGKFNSVSDASLVTGVDKSSISRCCHGSAMSAGGHRWRFE